MLVPNTWNLFSERKKMSTIIISGVLLIAVAGIVASLIRDKKKGKGACSGCSGCDGCSSAMHSSGCCGEPFKEDSIAEAYRKKSVKNKKQ